MQHESLSAIRRGPFTLGGVRFLHKFPEESANSRLDSSGFAAKVISSLSIVVSDEILTVSLNEITISTMLLRCLRFEFPSFHRTRDQTRTAISSNFID